MEAAGPRDRLTNVPKEGTGAMAGNQTCTAACEILCSIPFSPVPFAVLAAAFIGFIVGKLQSSRPRPIRSFHDGGGNRLGSAHNSTRSAHEAEAPEPSRAIDEEGTPGHLARPARIQVHAGGRGRQLQDFARSSDTVDDFTSSPFIDGPVENVFNMAPNSNSSRSSPSSRSSLMDLQERKQGAFSLAPKSNSSRSSPSSKSSLMDLHDRRQGVSPKYPTSLSFGAQSPRRQNPRAPPYVGGASQIQVDNPPLASETTERHRTPAPVSIPKSPRAVEVGTSSGRTPLNITVEPVFEAYENMDYSPRAETNQDSDDDEMIPAAAWMCGADAASKKLQCGLSWLNLVESSLEDVYGQIWMNSVHTDDYKKCKDVIFEAMEERGPFQVQYRLQVHAPSRELSRFSGQQNSLCLRISQWFISFQKH